MAKDGVEILHLGSAARDVASDDPRGWRLGGGVTYAALTTARLGLRTAAVVGVDADAASAPELDVLRAAGVEVHIVALAEGPVFHNIETAEGRIQLIMAPGVALPVLDLPVDLAAARAWSFTPVAGEIHDDWTAAIPAAAYVVVAWQGFLRELVAGQRVRRAAPQPLGLLRRADLVGVSHHDVDPATPLADLCRLLRPGADLLVTRGGDGGLLVHVGADGPARVVRYRPTRANEEVDPTGAGDTFLAALAASALRPAIAGRHRSRRPPDLRFAAAAGSLVVEATGLAGVPDRASVNLRRARETVRRAVLPSLEPQVGDYAGWPDETP
jgi:sugar/nucleoside kinase (ribokinase family)